MTKVIVAEHYRKTIDKNQRVIEDPKEEIRLIKLAKKGDKAAIHKLVCSQLLTIISIAKGFRKSGCDLNELIGCGVEGVMEAINRFDPSRNTRFITSATYWIKSRISIFVHEDDLVQIPAHKIAEIKRNKKAVDSGEISESEVTFTKHSMLSIHDNSGKSGDSLSFEEILGIDDELSRTMVLKNQVSKLTKTLSNVQEKRVLNLFFGLGGELPHTEEEVGEIMGISKQRVSQIKISALEKLKKKAFTITD